MIKFYIALTIFAIFIVRDIGATRCKPYSSFKIDCNDCICSADGITYACTEKICFQPPTKFQKEDNDFTLPNYRSKRDSDDMSDEDARSALMLDDENDNERIARETEDIQPIVILNDEDENTRIERDSNDILLLDDIDDSYRRVERSDSSDSDIDNTVLMIDDDDGSVVPIALSQNRIRRENFGDSDDSDEEE